MKTESAFKIVGGGAVKDRQAMDFYPTPPDVTRALLDYFEELRGLNILEPACGDGAMSKVLLEYGNYVTSSDLRESGYGTPNVNFLEGYKDQRFDAIITNPPFNVAEDFIKQSLTVAPFVAMVLKSQYWHAKTRQPLFANQTPAYVMPLTWRPDFLGGGASLMDVIWTVWIHGDYTTKYIPLQRPGKANQPDLFQQAS